MDLCEVRTWGRYFFWHRNTVTIQLLCYCVPAPPNSSNYQLLHKCGEISIFIFLSIWPDKLVNRSNPLKNSDRRRMRPSKSWVLEVWFPSCMEWLVPGLTVLKKYSWRNTLASCMFSSDGIAIYYVGGMGWCFGNSRFNFLQQICCMAKTPNERSWTWPG